MQHDTQHETKPYLQHEIKLDTRSDKQKIIQKDPQHETQDYMQHVLEHDTQLDLLHETQDKMQHVWCVICHV